MQRPFVKMSIGHRRASRRWRYATAAWLAGVAVAPLATADVPLGEESAHPHVTDADFERRVVSVGLEHPWEVAWGPDGYLWITERTGKRVTRVHPADGSKWTALELPEIYQSAGQDGLLGMALHPELLAGTSHDFVYLAFTYDASTDDASGGTQEAPVDRRVELRRYTYDWATQTLTEPMTLLAGLPASNDHNSGRMTIGPDEKLYYTVGDQGHNQFDNKCRPIAAQELPTREQVEHGDVSSYVGKILRLELDGAIPPDNPLIAGARSHVFSYGHRNAQGIVFGPQGTLYAAEHGPKSDDEINVIAAGQNYGWPHVAGHADDRAYAYANWSLAADCAELRFSDYVIPPSVPQALESAWPGPFVPPIQTFYTVPSDHDFTDPACRGNDYICWPTIAPAALDLYEARRHGIPGWSDSLLVVSLKRGAVLRSPLRRDGQGVLGEAEELFRTINRYRDIAQAPDGRAFYVVTDSTGQTSGPTEGFTGVLADPGAVLEFAYAPPPLASAPEQAPQCQRIDVQEHAGLYRLDLGSTVAEVDAHLGGRIRRFGWKSGSTAPSNLLTGPDVVAAADPAGQNNFGATLWTAPQSVWSWPPEPEVDSAPYAAELGPEGLRLAGSAGSISGFSVEKRFVPGNDRLHIEYVLANSTSEPRSAAPWEISRVPKAGLVLFPARFVALPASSLVSTWVDGIAWVDLTQPPEGDAKLFQDGAEGWLAYVLDDVAFIKRFEDIPREQQAPGEADVEIYVSGAFDYAELEQQGRHAEIVPGGSSEPWRVQWLLERLPRELRGQAFVGSQALVEWVREQVQGER